ncbi:MAG: hypothetical protein SH856_10930 [Flavobacteriales bacterium]|nr:hypothetical protein [Flavobacteriales bacterium]
MSLTIRQGENIGVTHGVWEHHQPFVYTDSCVPCFSTPLMQRFNPHRVIHTEPAILWQPNNNLLDQLD